MELSTIKYSGNCQTDKFESYWKLSWKILLSVSTSLDGYGHIFSTVAKMASLCLPVAWDHKIKLLLDAYPACGFLIGHLLTMLWVECWVTQTFSLFQFNSSYVSSWKNLSYRIRPAALCSGHEPSPQILSSFSASLERKITWIYVCICCESIC